MQKITMHKVLVNHNNDHSFTATLPGFYRAQETAPTEGEALEKLCARIMRVLERSCIVDLHVPMPKKASGSSPSSKSRYSEKSHQWKVVREAAVEYHVNTQSKDTQPVTTETTKETVETTTYKALVIPHQNNYYTARLLLSPDVCVTGDSQKEALDALRRKINTIHAYSCMVELEVAEVHTGTGNGKPAVHHVLILKNSDNRYTAYTLWLPEIFAADADQTEALEKLRNRLMHVNTQHVVELAIPTPEQPEDPRDKTIGIAKTDELSWDMLEEAIAANRKQQDAEYV